MEIKHFKNSIDMKRFICEVVKTMDICDNYEYCSECIGEYLLKNLYEIKIIDVSRETLKGK